MPTRKSSPWATSTAAIWAAGDFWTQQVSQLFAFLLVGNLLGPQVVGVMTMGLVVTLFFAVFLENGLSDALIQRVECDKSHFDSAFWLMVTFGTLSGVFVWLSTPLFVLAFAEPQLMDVLPWMAAALPFTAVTACYAAVLRRELRFQQLAIRSIVAYGAALLTTLAMAALGYGLASLIAFFVVSRFLSAILVIAAVRHWPGARVTRQALHDILGFGTHRIAQQAIAYLGSQSSRVLIGIFLGPVALGLYSIAERMVGCLNNGVSGVLHRVAFPVLSSCQNDRSTFDWTTQQFLTFANLIALPMFGGLAVISDRLVELLFAPVWRPAAPLLSILCIAALIAPTSFILVAATNALGRADIVLRLTVLGLIVRLAACLAATQFGDKAIAAMVAISSIVGMPMLLLATNRLFCGNWLHLFRGVAVPTLATAIMAGVTLSISPMLHNLSPLSSLVWQVSVGVITYTVTVGVASPDLFCRTMSFLGIDIRRADQK